MVAVGLIRLLKIEFWHIEFIRTRHQWVNKLLWGWAGGVFEKFLGVSGIFLFLRMITLCSEHFFKIIDFQLQLSRFRYAKACSGTCFEVLQHFEPLLDSLYAMERSDDRFGLPRSDD